MSAEESEAPPRGQSKVQALGKSDVSGASVLSALKGGDVTQYHLAGLWGAWVLDPGYLLEEDQWRGLPPRAEASAISP